MLDKTFDHATVETSLYEGWEKAGAFAAGAGGDPFTIMIPPPNVTGSLHMGHALTFTLQDALIRWRRMQGRDALWQPGTDHAGIATQMVVERLLDLEQTSRKNLGREAFVDRVWAWKQESGGTITTQLRRLGASLDWPRERFTMDDGLSEAVRTVFVSLYEKNLIYRARRLVNWDPKFQSAISDLEVETKEIKGHLWHIRYPIDGEPGRFLTVATTRPETMLGDTAVAVHPEDTRTKDLVGRFVILPLTGRKIPIVADTYADPEKGTGAVKITPAHDFNDFAVGQRHDLPMPSILDRQARITLAEIELFAIPGLAEPSFVHTLEGLDRDLARKTIVAELERLELLEKIEPHTHQVPHGDRSDVVIEPLLTVAMVLRRENARGPRHRSRRAGAHQVRAQTMGKHVLRLDARYRTLVHQPPALVGPSHSCLVCAGRFGVRGSHTGRRAGTGGKEIRCPHSAGAGRGCAGHLVQLRPLAVLHAGLAGKDRDAGTALSGRCAGYRLRHHLFLGRQDDDDGPAFYE